MKKSIFLIIGVTMLSLVGLHKTTYSQIDLTYTEPASCKQARTNAFDVLEGAWEEQLQTIVDQPTPTSNLVDDAFESFRTYRCWLEYSCRAVLYSSSGDPKLALNGLTKDHLGRIPGCVAPEKAGLPSDWSKVLDAMASPFNDGTVYNPPKNKFAFVPQCVQPDLNAAEAEYNSCLTEMNARITCEDPNDCAEESVAILKMQKLLTKTAASKKSRAVEEKLVGIVNRMLTMESRVNYLKQFISTLDDELECTSQQCT